MKTKIAVAAGLVALLVTVFGSAQAAPSIVVKVPFQFMVNNATLPAGEYNFIRSNDEQSFQIVSTNKGPSAAVLVLTRLGKEIHVTPEDAHVVFDKVGDTYFLSEVWLPRMDGFLLRATKEKHEHRSINIPS